MKKIIFLGILSFLLAALWQLPLSFAKPYIEKYVKGLTMEDVSGTIWNGEAKQMTADNTSLGHVKWKVDPLKSLTSLSLSSSFKIDDNDLNAKGLAALTPKKKLILDNTQFSINADYLNKLQKNAKLAGDISGNIKHAVLDQKNLPEINGTIDWKEGAIDSPIKLAKGDYHAILTPDAGDLKILLSSSDAPAELNGEIRLNKEWMFETDLSIKAKDKGLGSMLGLIGKKQADGTIIVKQKGDLKPFIGK